jgi:hypothetical protein
LGWLVESVLVREEKRLASAVLSHAGRKGLLGVGQRGEARE